MFTIKHIAADGNEHMVECHRFARERRSEGFTQFMAYPENPVPMEYIASWCGDERVADRLECDQTIYVMNRFGATVATYRFKQPDLSVGQPTDIAEAA